MPQLSVLVSTYNEPLWLEWVLLGYARQTFKDFDLIVVDDGSGPETRARIDALRPELPFHLEHFWQPDEGYQKCKAMNRGIALARSDYLVFSDGDCVPRADFLARHAAQREPGRYLSGGYSKLPMALSRQISRDDVLSGRATDYRWLAANGLQRHTLKLRANRPWMSAVLNRLTPVAPRFHGHNASAWKADILRVNGWDERMQYGGQDIELGERLNNAGIRGKTIRYSAVCVHLEHHRNHRKPGMKEHCRAIRAETQRTRAVWTPYGIRKDTAAPSRQPSPSQSIARSARVLENANA